MWVTRLAGHRSHRVFRGPCCVDLWTPPLWSPDGRRIALGLGWSRGRTAGGIATFVLDADGRNVHRLPASSEELAWRPSLR